MGRGDTTTADLGSEDGQRLQRGFVGPVRAGERQTVRAWVVREPVEVTEVVEAPGRVGFPYRTLPGHPVRGEEAFILTREAGVAALTIRSLTAPSGSQPWRLAFPVLRVVQHLVRRRYFRALR